MNLVELLYQAVERYPDKDALRVKRNGKYEGITFRALWEQIHAFANGLRLCGVKEGSKVGIISTNCPEWPITDFATLLIGAVLVPVYPTLPAGQVEYILRNGDVEILVAQDESQYEKVRDHWPPLLRRVIVIQGSGISLDGRVISFANVMEMGRNPRGNLAPIHFRAIPEDSLATIVHTSGTSGQPKGVMLSHRNIVSNVQSALTTLPVGAEDVSLSFLPLSHIFERTVGQYAALSVGGTVVYADSVDTVPQQLLEVKPTILITVPRLLEKVYAKVQENLAHAPAPVRRMAEQVSSQGKASGFQYRLVDRLVYRKLRAALGGRIRYVVSGGAGLNAQIAKFYIGAGIPIYEGYGMTEAAPVIAANPYGASRPGTVGKPIPGVEVRIAEDGELLVRGPNVMMGYYKQPDETEKTIDPDGWLHTGDIAELDPDGYLRIVDRKKNILVLATGKNVAPWPVENAIILSRYISEAVLLGDGRKYVACILVPDFEALAPLAKELGLAEDKTTWVRHPQIRSLIGREVAKQTEGFADFERPKRAILLPRELSLEDGELTPSLKVRTKVLMQKYGREIERMYEGIDYIPTLEGAGTPGPMGDVNPATDDAAPATVAAVAVTGAATAAAQQGAAPAVTPTPARTGASSAAAERRRRRRRWPWGVAAIVVIALAAAAMHAHAMNPTASPLPKQLNLVGMVSDIRNKNDKLNQVNGQIVQSMEQISNMSETTASISNKLGTLSGGLKNQYAALSTLNDLSQQEVDLSNSLHGLSITAYTDMQRIGQASKTQDAWMQQMQSLAQQLGGAAGQLVTINQTMAGKLDTARQKAAHVASEMP
ncbi:MAG: long-chain fatty acid--CoA ligase [Thermoflavifilum sp.]|nr:long-chain fatty acid--CoA ligase [Thermoflavifilum sp.]MCL6514373.1 long-chain fatty acid--CoA ligase [Alicyclobacillus sp.]